MVSTTSTVLNSPSSSRENVRRSSTSSFTRSRPSRISPRRARAFRSFLREGSARCGSISGPRPSSPLSTMNRLFTTKASGLLISCAMPATSCPSEAIFSFWISWAWVSLSFRLASCRS